MQVDLPASIYVQLTFKYLRSKGHSLLTSTLGFAEEHSDIVKLIAKLEDIIYIYIYDFV
jgi:hypothetical protein